MFWYTGKTLTNDWWSGSQAAVDVLFCWVITCPWFYWNTLFLTLSYLQFLSIIQYLKAIFNYLTCKFHRSEYISISAGLKKKGNQLNVFHFFSLNFRSNGWSLNIPSIKLLILNRKNGVIDNVCYWKEPENVDIYGLKTYKFCIWNTHTLFYLNWN